MATPPKSSSVIVVRSKQTVALPPSLLGYNEFDTPDTYDPAKPKFKGNFHFTPPAILDLAALIQTKCCDALYEQLVAEAAEFKPPVKMKVAQAADEWLEAKLKPAREDATSDWQQLPFIQVAMPATFKDKQGEVQTKAVAVWDGKNNKLNLKKLKLGRGSTVQAIVTPQLFFSKLIGFPQPSLKLVGIRVLKLTSWATGGASAPERDDEEIRNVLGADFEMDDLAMYGGADDFSGADDSAPDAEAIVKDMF